MSQILAVGVNLPVLKACSTGSADSGPGWRRSWEDLPAELTKA
jgi:hypothetical protein